ncbi:hypothetical protein DL96DRAFT_117321 [Flagelloscypha sp. PMI_526]|nr:hypothetical protein DL96DRAFT_117321 [Flagelloscypha sp. PMI_526]
MEKKNRPKHEGKAILSRMSRGLVGHNCFLLHISPLRSIQVACAECKRMKLKCDKKIPCSSCVRRECSSICPTGILISRQASRSILAKGSSARRTQDAITRLRERNLQLEEALAFAHSHMSKDIHPLLAENSFRERPQDDPEVDKVIEVLGTLSVGETGEPKYFGPSAVVEPKQQVVDAGDKHVSSLVSPQPDLDSILEIPSTPAINMESFAFVILNDLPARTRAWSLCEIFYEHYPIFSMPIQEKDLMQSYLHPMYKYREESFPNHKLPPPSTSFRPHRCAIVFFVFAIAAWMDLTKKQYWVEADRYFQIGLSCFSMQSIFYSPEVATVQALFLLVSYNQLRGAASTATLSPGWTILSLACKISQGLGLHRDSARWNLDKLTVHHRRWLYWELVSMELFYCLGTGRPLSGRPSYVDTELPDDGGQTDAHGQLLREFFRSKHEAIRDCYIEVVEIALAAIPAKYEMILDLDCKVRAKEIPAHLNRILVDAEDGPDITAPEFMHQCMLGVARSMVLLSLHRCYLTEALKEPSGNPLKSRYAPSFLASYRAASWVLKSYHAGQKRFPALFARLWHPWSAVLTSAMVLGSIAMSTPSSLVGNGPLEELRVAASMFEEAIPQTVSHRTKDGARMIQKILARAEEAQARHLVAGAGVVLSGISIPPTNYGDDELAIFGGQDRLLSVSPRQAPLQFQDGLSSRDSDSSVSFQGSLEDIHPSLIEFLNTAPMTQVACATTFQEMLGTTPESPFVSLFRDPRFMPSQTGDWARNALPTSQNPYHLGNDGGPSISESQIPDTFENYLSVPASVDLGSEPSDISPWQDFMIQHSLI